MVSSCFNSADRRSISSCNTLARWYRFASSCSTSESTASNRGYALRASFTCSICFVASSICSILISRGFSLLLHASRCFSRSRHLSHNSLRERFRASSLSIPSIRASRAINCSLASSTSPTCGRILDNRSSKAAISSCFTLIGPGLTGACVRQPRFISAILPSRSARTAETVASSIPPPVKMLCN